MLTPIKSLAIYD